MEVFILTKKNQNIKASIIGIIFNMIYKYLANRWPNMPSTASRGLGRGKLEDTRGRKN
jgi:hypothetical protein